MQTSHGRRAFFFFNDTATTEIYTLSLHDALPISHGDAEPSSDRLLSEREMARALDQVLRSEEHTSELQSQSNLVCRLLLEKKKKRSNARCRRLSTPNRPKRHSMRAVLPSQHSTSH